MSSRPRPSLLALFDPLTISDASTQMQMRDTASPAPSMESGSDKENLISTTLKGSYSKTDSGEVASPAKAKDSWNGRLVQIDLDSKLESLASSFSLEPSNDETSNLCLVQLAVELASACKSTDLDDILVPRPQGPREPLSETSLFPCNDSNKTPQSLACDKHLINFDSPGTTPKSLRKFASGIVKHDSFTPSVHSPLASRGPAHAPPNWLPKVDSPCVISYTPLNPMNRDPMHALPPIPFASQSLSLLSSTPASEPRVIFHDPPSNCLGSSFDFSDPSNMKRMNVTGDLLKDDLSFLEHLEEDSLADFERGNTSDRTTSSSPRTPQGMGDEGVLSEQNNSPGDVRLVEVDEKQSGSKIEYPTKKESTAFRRSSSHSGLVFGAKREVFSMNLSSPIKVEPRTPSSSPSARSNKYNQAFAPKKSRPVLRRSGTSLRSTNTRNIPPVKGQGDDEEGNTKVGEPRTGVQLSRSPSVEIKTLARSQSLTVKQVNKATATNAVSPFSLERRASISRPSASFGRRPSIGRALSPVRRELVEPKQKQTQKPSLSLPVQNVRRLSVSTSSKPTPIKANNFATAGRLGGARRVPVAANTPLFKVNESLAKGGVESPKSIPRSSTTESKSGPRRPSVLSGTSRTLGRSTSRPPVPSLDKPASTPASTRTLGRAASVSSTVFTRSSSFMTSSGSATSRPSLLPPKPVNKIPGSATRKAF